MRRSHRFDWIAQKKVRLYSIITLLSVLPLLLFSYSAHELLKRQMTERASRESAQVARLAARLIEEQFVQSTTLMHSIAERPLLKKACSSRDFKAIDFHLEQGYKLNANFVFFSIYDLDGTMRAIYPSSPEVLNRNFAFRDWYRVVASGWRPYVSEVYQTAVPPKQLVTAVVVPVNDQNGKPVAILMAPYKLTTIKDWMSQIDADSPRKISIVDQHGMLVAAPGLDIFQPPKDVSDFEPVRRLKIGETGSGLFQRGGNELMVAYAPIPSLGWGMLVELPTGALASDVWEFERRIVLFGLVFFGLALIFGSILGGVYRRLETGNRFLDLSIDMFCTASFDGHFEFVNQAWEKCLWFTAGELLAKPFMEFVHPEVT